MFRLLCLLLLFAWTSPALAQLSYAPPRENSWISSLTTACIMQAERAARGEWLSSTCEREILNHIDTAVSNHARTHPEPAIATSQQAAYEAWVRFEEATCASSQQHLCRLQMRSNYMRLAPSFLLTTYSSLHPTYLSRVITARYDSSFISYVSSNQRRREQEVGTWLADVTFASRDMNLSHHAFYLWIYHEAQALSEDCRHSISCRGSTTEEEAMSWAMTRNHSANAHMVRYFGYNHAENMEMRVER